MRTSRLIDKLKGWERHLKRDVIAIGLAARGARVPWHAKAVAIKMIAAPAMPDLRTQAAERDRPNYTMGMVVIALIWAGALTAAAWSIWNIV